MTKAFLIGVTAVAATAACADYVGASWQADDAGNWSGSVLDTAHWSGGEVPGSEGATATRMVFAKGNGDYTVSNLTAAAVNSAGIEASVAAGETLTFEGRGTTWTLPSGTAHDLLWFQTGGAAPFVWLSADSTSGLKLDNYLVEYSNETADKPGAWLDIQADTLDLSPASGNLILFGKWAMAGDPSGFATIRMRDAAIEVPHPLIFAAFNQMTNRVILSNCRGRFGSGARNDVWNGSADSADNDRAGLQEFYVTDSSVVSNTASFATGYYSANNDGSERFSSRSKTFRLKIDEGAKLYQHSFGMDGRGRNEVLVSGEGSAFINYSNGSSVGNGLQSTGLVSVVDGAAWTNYYPLYLGPRTAANLDTSWAEFQVKNALAYVKQSVAVYHGRVTMEDACWFYTGQGYVGGQGVEGATEELVLNGTTLKTIGTDVSVPNPIRNLTAAKIGPRGFTFVPGTSHVVRFDQHFEDLDPTNGGELCYLGMRFASLLLSGDAISKESTESRLTLSGAYALAYIDKDCNHYSYLTVTNGATLSLLNYSDKNITFSGATAIRLRGIRLGNAVSTGSLALKADDLVTVDNDSLELENAKITFSTTLGLGEHTVFRLTQQPTDETVAFWEGAGASVVTAGLDKSLYNSFQVVAENDVWNFKIVTLAERPAKTADTTWTGSSATWDGETAWGGDSPSAAVGATFAGAEPKDITVSGERQAASLAFTDDGYALSGGRVMIPDNTGAAITASGTTDFASDLHLYTQVPVNVAEGKTLTLGGRIFGGGLAKSGEGTLRLDNADNLLPSGVSLAAGTLEVGDTESLGGTGDNTPGVLSGGTLRFTEPGEVKARMTIAGPVTIENVAAGEVSMTAPAGTAGSLTKTGAAPLALKTSTDTVWASGTTSPSAIEEGELRLCGENGATLNLQKDFHIGRKDATSASAEPTQPGLVVSGDMTAKVARLHTMEGLAADAGTFVTDPYLVVSNGATLHCTDGMLPGNNNSRQSLAFHILLDNGTLKSTGSEFDMNSTTYAVASTNYITMRNGSKMTSWYQWGRFSVQCPFIFDMDASELAGGDPDHATSCLQMYMNGGYGPFHCTFNVRNGSVLRCRAITYSPWAATHEGSYNQPWRFNFEDSEWDLGDETIDMPSSNMTVIVTSTGPTGIVFAPPATRTWKIYTRIDGTGAFTKRGAGHVLVDRRMKFRAYTADPITLGLSGAIRVEDGTMKIVDGALSNMTGRVFAFANGATLDMDGVTLDHPVLTGDGRILNATLDNPSCAVSVSAAGEVTGAPTLDFSTATGRVRVDFGRAPDDPLPEDVPLVVAHWTGTKPSAAILRGKNAGRGMKCFFEVNDDGTIVATARRVGLLLIVR